MKKTVGGHGQTVGGDWRPGDDWHKIKEEEKRVMEENEEIE